MQMQRCELEMSTRARGICSNDDVYEDMTLWSYDDGEVSFHVKPKPDKQCQTLKRKIRDGDQDVSVASKRSKRSHTQSRPDDRGALTKCPEYKGSTGTGNNDSRSCTKVDDESYQTKWPPVSEIPSSATETLNKGVSKANGHLKSEGETGVECLSEPEGETGVECLSETEGETGVECLSEPKGETGVEYLSEPEGETVAECLPKSEAEIDVNKQSISEGEIWMNGNSKSERETGTRLSQVPKTAGETGASRLSGTSEGQDEISVNIFRKHAKQDGEGWQIERSPSKANRFTPSEMSFTEDISHNYPIQMQQTAESAVVNSARPHVGKTGTVCPTQMRGTRDTKGGYSTHVRETEASQLSRPKGGEIEMMGLARSHLGEVIAGYLPKSDDRETGEGGHNRSPHVGDTGASCPTGRSDACETGTCCSTQSTHERRNEMWYPTRISQGGMTRNVFNARIPNIGENGASCPMRMPYTREFTGSCLIWKQHEKTERSHPKEKPLREKPENRCYIRKSDVGDTGASQHTLPVGECGAKWPSIQGKSEPAVESQL